MLYSYTYINNKIAYLLSFQGNKSDNYVAEAMEKKYLEGISTSLNEKSEDVKLRFGGYANKDIITVRIKYAISFKNKICFT